MKKENGSLTLTKIDWKKIAMHTFLVALAAGLTYLSELIPNFDLGNYTILVTTVISILLKALQRFVSVSQ